MHKILRYSKLEETVEEAIEKYIFAILWIVIINSWAQESRFTPINKYVVAEANCKA